MVEKKSEKCQTLLSHLGSFIGDACFFQVMHHFQIPNVLGCLSTMLIPLNEIDISCKKLKINKSGCL